MVRSFRRPVDRRRGQNCRFYRSVERDRDETQYHTGDMTERSDHPHSQQRCPAPTTGRTAFAPPRRPMRTATQLAHRGTSIATVRPNATVSHQHLTQQQQQQQQRACGDAQCPPVSGIVACCYHALTGSNARGAQ